MPPDDERLARLVAANRFSDFYGELLFLGGGAAVPKSRSQSVNRAGADGRTVLDDVIAAALSESVPATAVDGRSVALYEK